ncbi:2-nitropropane dioxygenase, partial [Apiospora marii]|uniref:2-nitropropane dioxygenase n=1 Tax=Apiospora marii TaxID=335849 RepID=UPI00312E152D
MSLLRFKALTPTPAIRRFATTMASSTARTRMQRWFPTTSSPLIVSAPMDFVTNATLASEVSKAGGLGFIQGGRDFTPGCAALSKLDRELGQARNLLSGVKSSENTLPLGVGFVAYAPSVSHFAETAVPVLESYRPAAVWLFAPAPDQPGTIGDMIRALRSSSSSSPGEWNDQVKVAVQVGSVAAAREAVQYGADIVVAQGVDAGGHQWARGASVVSLVPEIADMVSTSTGSTGREVAVWAAGGLAEGRGVAASLVLGAEAAVLGTRFMVAAEADTQEFKRKAILSTSDGGMNTVKSQLHDHIQGNMSWPDLYDGRAVVNPCYQDYEAGLSLEENVAKFKAAKDAGDTSRMTTWSGTGVGLIKESLPAGEVVKQLRESATKALQP